MGYQKRCIVSLARGTFLGWEFDLLFWTWTDAADLISRCCSFNINITNECILRNSILETSRISSISISNQHTNTPTHNRFPLRIVLLYSK